MRNKISNYHDVLNKMMNTCSKREYCEFDIRKKLYQSKIMEEAASGIIQTLRAENFINDSRYCRAYVNDKFRLNKWGKIKIEYSLKSKGLSSSEIKKSLENINEQEYHDIIKNEIEVKNKKIKAENEFERKSKILQFASQRGYESDIVKKIIGI
jgi:regulatory protein